MGHPEYRRAIAVVAYTYFTANGERISELLGGEPTLFTVVPSKRGIEYADQPLQRALKLVPPWRERFVSTLKFSTDASIGRWQYRPESFRRGLARVRGERIVLIEDTWVTGTTVVSAAGGQGRSRTL